MPISGRPSLAKHLTQLDEAARAEGRDPRSLRVTVMGAAEDPARVENLFREGIDRAVFTIWDEPRDDVLRSLDRLTGLREQLLGAR